MSGVNETENPNSWSGGLDQIKDFLVALDHCGGNATIEARHEEIDGLWLAQLVQLGELSDTEAGSLPPIAASGPRQSCCVDQTTPLPVHQEDEPVHVYTFRRQWSHVVSQKSACSKPIQAHCHTFCFVLFFGRPKR